eukprot:CAMPEP_0175232002 /NCGR_PEP_ID=MMETSP0093-20121207/25743_1 /TAXON_ID=311494 /ORGANISM="Alexandrium monilatum, Strain CCMP3105" /LENGTH=128 /DNA_ID=CAMNT_0016525863 /DNA_START=50 /DNA_END=436 /DNA_ORIENTATION=+
MSSAGARRSSAEPARRGLSRRLTQPRSCVGGRIVAGGQLPLQHSRKGPAAVHLETPDLAPARSDEGEAGHGPSLLLPQGHRTQARGHQREPVCQAAIGGVCPAAHQPHVLPVLQQQLPCREVPCMMSW